jgi:hypothetical protein
MFRWRAEIDPRIPRKSQQSRTPVALLPNAGPGARRRSARSNGTLCRRWLVETRPSLLGMQPTRWWVEVSRGFSAAGRLSGPQGEAGSVQCIHAGAGVIRGFAGARMSVQLACRQAEDAIKQLCARRCALRRRAAPWCLVAPPRARWPQTGVRLARALLSRVRPAASVFHTGLALCAQGQRRLAAARHRDQNRLPAARTPTGGYHCQATPGQSPDATHRRDGDTAVSPVPEADPAHLATEAVSAEF